MWLCRGIVSKTDFGMRELPARKTSAPRCVESGPAIETKSVGALPCVWAICSATISLTEFAKSAKSKSLSFQQSPATKRSSWMPKRSSPSSPVTRNDCNLTSLTPLASCWTRRMKTKKYYSRALRALCWISTTALFHLLPAATLAA